MGASRVYRRFLWSVTLAAVLGLVSGVPLWAQTTSASISGTVKDAQGGVLPGVTVTLLSETKGTETAIVTDGLGNFTFPYIPPDTYKLKVSLEGFQTLEHPSIRVNANDRLAVGPYTLAVGAVSESITVSGRAADIQLKSGERAYTMESSAMQNLAVNGRSFYGLASLVPGVVTGSSEPTQADAFNVNGQRANSNNMTIDGVANVDTGNNAGNMAQTNIDSIAEFKILTSSYQAEYGRAVGGQVQVVTKSGTRNFSGSGYYYARRSDWNAETWWNNRNGVKQAKSERNDYGGTLGGPLFIPGLFNEEKNKLFFFVSQEFQRRKDPVGEQRATVPTALERKGDFSQSVDSNGNPYPYIRDYTTGLPCSASNTSGCFQDGGVLGRIPASRLYAPTLAALGVYPEPNVSGQVGYNYRSQTAGKNPLDQTMVRLDYQVNNNWRVTGRYMFHKNKPELPYGISGWSIRSNLDTIQVVSDVPGDNFMVSSTGILNNTTSLEFSFGRAHNSLDHYSESPTMTRAGSGTASIPMLYPNAIQMDLIPQFQFGGGRIGNAPFFNTGQAPFTNFNTTYDVVANLTKILGTHSMKAGVYFQRSLKDQSAFAYHNGQYVFNNSTNNPFDSQHPFANAVLGIYDSFTQANEFLKPQWRYSNLEWYVQDNWKASDRLTLDYGVRFYFLTPQWDQSEKASNFVPEDFNKSSAVRLYKPAVVDGVRVGYDAVTGGTVNSAFIGRIVPGSGNRFQGTTQGGTLTDGNKFRISPRLGFAYDITGEQAFIARGAFGMLYDRPQGNQVFDLITNPPGMQVTTLNWGLVKDVAGAQGLFAPVGLNPNVYAWETPVVYQWNVGVQAKLPAKMTLDVAYVGSKSEDLLQKRQINALPYGTAYLASSMDPTRGQTCTGCSGLSATPGGNALATDFLRPYQGYGNINLWEFSGYSNYNALQTSLNRRFSNGFMVGVSYVLSSAKGISGGDWDGARIDGKDREANYGLLGYDRTHVITSSFIYQTPTVTDGPLGVLVNDWQISGNYRWMSGTPYGVGYSISGIGAINLTGSDQGARILITGDTGVGHSDDPYKMFNTSAFQAPSAGSNGLESPLRYMRGLPINNLDMSLSKSVSLGGRRRIEVRLDAFNALNHTQFSGINTTANFASMGSTTVTNLASETGNKTGFGSVNGVRNARQLQLMTRLSF